jgi:hypothetical protein
MSLMPPLMACPRRRRFHVVNAFNAADTIGVVMVGVVRALLVAPVDVDVAAAIDVNVDAGSDDPRCVATGFD